MAKDLDTRLKMGPLKPQWDTIKGRNALLKNNGINTSALTSMLQKYDGHIARLKVLDAEWWKLDEALPPLLAKATSLGAKLADLDDQLKNLQTKDQAVVSPASDKLIKLAPDPKADPQQILAALDDMVGSGGDLVTGRSGLWSQMDKIAKDKLQALTKVRDDYRTKITANNKEVDTLTTSCDTLENDMQKAVSKYQAEARKLDHKDVATDMDAFILVLKGP